MVCLRGTDIPLVNHGAADLNLYRDPGPGRYALPCWRMARGWRAG